jgi:hypothetical protein
MAGRADHAHAEMLSSASLLPPVVHPLLTEIRLPHDNPSASTAYQSPQRAYPWISDKEASILCIKHYKPSQEGRHDDN